MQHQLGAVGVRHEIQVVERDAAGALAVVNISSASAGGQKKIRFLPPAAGAAVEKNATFVTDGTDGKLVYVTQDADGVGTAIGIWRRQALLVLTGWSGPAELEAFEVKGNG